MIPNNLISTALVVSALSIQTYAGKAIDCPRELGRSDVLGKFSITVNGITYEPRRIYPTVNEDGILLEGYKLALYEQKNDACYYRVMKPVTDYEQVTNNKVDLELIKPSSNAVQCPKTVEQTDALVKSSVAIQGNTYNPGRNYLREKASELIQENYKIQLADQKGNICLYKVMKPVIHFEPANKTQYDFYLIEQSSPNAGVSATATR